MATEVKIEAVPTFTRNAGESKYTGILTELTALVTDEKKRATTGLLFGPSDGVHVADLPVSEQHPAGIKANVQQVLQLFRLSAKQVGQKIALVIKPEGVYVKWNGQYVEMTPEQKLARKEARDANAAAKNMHANTEAKAAAAGAPKGKQLK